MLSFMPPSVRPQDLSGGLSVVWHPWSVVARFMVPQFPKPIRNAPSTKIPKPAQSPLKGSEP